MELEDFETIHLAREVARENGWEHVLAAIREALQREADALSDGSEADGKAAPAALP